MCRKGAPPRHGDRLRHVRNSNQDRLTFGSTMLWYTCCPALSAPPHPARVLSPSLLPSSSALPSLLRRTTPLYRSPAKERHRHLVQKQMQQKSWIPKCASTVFWIQWSIMTWPWLLAIKHHTSLLYSQFIYFDCREDVLCYIADSAEHRLFIVSSYFPLIPHLFFCLAIVLSC